MKLQIQSKKFNITAPFLLVKVGDPRHIESLQNEGDMFFRSIHEFSVGSRPQWSDADEKASFVKNIGAGNLKLFKQGTRELITEMQLKDAVYREVFNDPVCNIFCMYKIEVKDILSKESIELPLEMRGFGSDCLVIFDVLSFFDRFEACCKTQLKEFEHRSVTYNKIRKGSGKKSIFEKDVLYSLQSEYRFAIRHNQLDPFNFKIGNLEDISYRTFDSPDNFKLKGTIPVLKA